MVGKISLAWLFFPPPIWSNWKSSFFFCPLLWTICIISGFALFILRLVAEAMFFQREFALTTLRSGRTLRKAFWVQRSQGCPSAVTVGGGRASMSRHGVTSPRRCTSYHKMLFLSAEGQHLGF